MSKIKVSELAKELDKSSRDIIVALKKGCRVFVDGQNSVITEEQAEKVKAYLKKQEEEKKNAGAGQAVPSVAVMENKTAASAQQTRHLGGLDSRGNYVADAPQDQGPARPARKTVKAAETKQAEKQPAEKAKEQPGRQQFHSAGIDSYNRVYHCKSHRPDLQGPSDEYSR